MKIYILPQLGLHLGVCEISMIGVLKHPRGFERCGAFQNATPLPCTLPPSYQNL